VRRSVVAVDTVHPARIAVRDLIGGQRTIAIVVLSDVALAILDSHPRNHLAMIVDRDVGHFVPDVHVPVNAFDGSGGGTTTTDVYQHASLPQSVLLVIAIAIENLQLCTEELLRPVTLLASFLRRPKVVYRSLNWAGVFIKCDRVKLISPGQFRFHIPTRARPDVTTDAGHARVRARLISSELRFHHGVTSRPAERDRLGVFESAITAERAGANEEERNEEK